MDSIRSFLLNNMLWAVFICAGLLYFVWIFYAYSAFRTENRELKVQFVEAKQQMLKREVSEVIEYIHHMKEQAEERLENNIRQRVYDAHSIAQNLFYEYDGTRTEDEIKKIIRDALRPIRFNRGRGYYFIFSPDGIVELSAGQPDIEGSRLPDIQTNADRIIEKQMIPFLTRQPEGFFNYPSAAPDNPNAPPQKIAFIKRFEPYGWGIGAAEYRSQVIREIQNEILVRIVQLRFENEGYFFGSLYGGRPLFTNGRITKGTQSIWELKDPNGVLLIQAQNREAQKKEGGFVRYQWPKLGSDKLYPKISYVNDVPEWQWIIGAGVYLDTIDAAIEEKTRQLFSNLLTEAVTSLCILFTVSLFIYFRINSYTREIQAGINSFSRFFEKASTDSTLIDPSQFRFKEIKQIAAGANRMLEKQIKASKALKLSEKRYAAIADTALDSIFTKDADRKYTFVNKAMTKLFNCRTEDLLGKRPEELFDSESAAAIREVDDRAFNGEPVNEIRTLVVQGVPLTFHTIQVPLEIIKGRVVSVSGVVRDITEQRRAEQATLLSEQRAAEQEKHALVGQVAGKIAHDFNNILGVIMGNTELALIDCKDPETKKVLELIHGQTQRGKNLTKNLIAFAKDQEPKQEFFHIHEKIDLVIALLKKELEGVQLFRDYQANIPEVLADPGMIEHALVNLIQNSVHALSMQNNPKISIRTYTKKDHVWCEIKDNGCGIPSDQIQHIFTPSFTLKGSRDVRGSYSTGIKGTGYGLSNVKKYIEQHRGQIHAGSEPGKSATFAIGLPIIEKQLTPLEIKSFRAEKIIRNRTVLIVEDEAAISDVQYRVLTGEPCCHQVDVATNGKKALEMIARRRYDCISLDYILPGKISGMDIYQQVRKSYADLPVLFISGNIEFLESIKALKKEDPFLEHLSKPAPNTLYLHHINNLLGRIPEK